MNCTLEQGIMWKIILFFSLFFAAITAKVIFVGPLRRTILHVGDFPQPQQKYAGTGENGNFEIAVVF